MSADLALVKDKVETYLRELVGGYEVDDEGDLNFRMGSARVYIHLGPFGEENTLVAIRAFTNYRVPASPELFHYVATNNQYVFGSLSAREVEDGVVVTFSHCLLGDYLDPQEFRWAVSAVAKTARARQRDQREVRRRRLPPRVGHESPVRPGAPAGSGSSGGEAGWT